MTDRTLTWGGAPTAGEPTAASPFPDRYEDLGPLAEGGMGEVRRVRDRLLDCVVAMKRLSADRVGSDAARARFVVEAKVTARLRHPGIVAVHDRGEAADGGLWYTMTEVRGRTLAEHLAGDRSDLRHLVTALLRACEAMAYAHREGVVHRDLKPENLMLGPFGEVIVVDWGLAAPVGALAGGAVGTPGWVAPEQARGEAPAPAADVYALGGILHAILAGRPPRVGPPARLWASVREDPPLVDPPGPAPLVAACVAAMDPDPSRRPREAGALGALLAAWLDDAARRADAEAILERAMRAIPEISRLRSRAVELRSRARVELGALPPYAPSEAKGPAWQLEDAALGADREATLLETTWLQDVGAALQRDPTLDVAHAALADHWAGELLRAEADRRADDAIRAEVLLRRHDRGAHVRLLRGDGTLTLVTDPPGAEVHLCRFVERGRRLVPEPAGILGVTPLLGAALGRGSWLLELRRPDRADVRVPVFLGRGEDWDGVRPGEREPCPIVLPRVGELGPDDRYVPAGWFWCGGGAGAVEPLPRQRIWVDALVVRRFPVTVGEFRAFLAEVARTDPGLARDLGPIGRAVDGGGPLTRFGREGVTFDFAVPRTDRHPMTQIRWPSAVAFAEAEARRTGLPWRLPDEVEWEKAARGVDGRTWPCGEHAEPTWFNVLGAAATPRELEAVGQHPLDESVYGVRDLVGNAVDQCANGWRDGRVPTADGRFVGTEPPGDDLRVGRGGGFTMSVGQGGCASRTADARDAAFPVLGFRLVRSYVLS